MKRLSTIAVSLAASLVLSAGEQDLPPNAPTKEPLANDNKLFIELATKYLKWDEPAEPIRIVGPLYGCCCRPGNWQDLSVSSDSRTPRRA